MAPPSTMRPWRLLIIWAFVPTLVTSVFVGERDSSDEDVVGPAVDNHLRLMIDASQEAVEDHGRRDERRTPLHSAAALLESTGGVTGNSSKPFFTVSSARHLFAVIVVALGFIICSLWLTAPPAKQPASLRTKEQAKALQHAEVQSNQDDIWPATLTVTSEYGHGGTYHLVPGLRPNGLPLWKRESGQDWLFCGVSGQWFIGDEFEEQQNFRCDTGNIASYEVHAGRMPDEIGPGGWLYFNGEDWLEKRDLNITSEQFTSKDQQATSCKQNTAAVKIQSSYRGISSRRRCGIQAKQTP